MTLFMLETYGSLVHRKNPNILLDHYTATYGLCIRHCRTEIDAGHCILKKRKLVLNIAILSENKSITQFYYNHHLCLSQPSYVVIIRVRILHYKLRQATRRANQWKIIFMVCKLFCKRGRDVGPPDVIGMNSCDVYPACSAYFLGLGCRKPSKWQC